MTQIKVGFCRKDLTPEGSIALGGYGDDPRRMSEGVLDHIFGTCIAISDPEDNTALLFSADLLHANTTMTARLRASASKATGVPEDHIMVSSTHTHAGPGISSPQLPCIQRFYDLYEVLMTEAAVGAMADRAPADIYLGDAYTHNLNFVRHYRMNDGTYAGDNFGNWKSGIAGHASPADNQIQLIKFAREGKTDIVIMNWQAHAKVSSTAETEFGQRHRRWLSADYIGYARDAFEKLTGTQMIFFTGAAGNMNIRSRVPEETPSELPSEVGQALAEAAVPGLENMRKVSGGKLTTRQRIISVEIDHSDDHLVEKAQEVWDLWATDPELCKKVAKEKGFNSAYACRDIIGRSKTFGTRELEIDTVAVGDIAFATASYEMFDTNARYIKENSPFEKTIVMSCCNGANSYLASELAFSHGSYEVDSRLFSRGTAEMLVENHVQMLKEQREA